MNDQRKAGSLNVLVRRRRMRRRVVTRVATVKPRQSRIYHLTESEFVSWLRDLAADPKWKNPTPWDEHTFRVGVLTELRHVRSPNSELSDK